MKRSFALVTLAVLMACGSSTSPPVAPVVADVPAATTAPAASPAPSASTQVTDAKAEELARQAEQMQLAVLGSSSTRGASSASPDAAARPVDLSGAAPPSSSTPKVAGPKGDVQLGGTTATPPLANGDRVVAGLRPRVRQCYQQGLNSDPSMSGKIVLSVKVGPNGEVHSATASSNVGMSPAVVACVQRVFRMAQFEAPGGGGSTMSAPMTFVVTK